MKIDKNNIATDLKSVNPLIYSESQADSNNVNYVEKLTEIMARLRGKSGCPWDREQNHHSLKEFLVEETAELIDAINDNKNDEIIEELGDILLQVVFHCQIAAEENRFNLQDVARGICEKLVRRHPHVFADSQVESPTDVIRQWEKIKKEEKNIPPTSNLDGVPRSLPALHRADKIQKKAAKAGFDWPTVDGVIAKIEEELTELREAILKEDDQAIAEEIGDLLFSVVNLSRYRKKMAEDLLHATIEKFHRRFRRIEESLMTEGKSPEDCTLEQLDRLWNQAKKEKNRPIT